MAGWVGWAGDPRTEAQNVELSAHQFHSTPPEAHTQHGHSDSDDDYHSDSDGKLKSALRIRLQHKAIEQYGAFSFQYFSI